MTRLAERSGLERTHLYRKLKQLDIKIGSVTTTERSSGRGRNEGHHSGAGQVGASVAEGLCRRKRHHHRRSGRGAAGPSAGSSRSAHRGRRRGIPSILRRAGADDADMVIALTQSDQSNLVARKLAHGVFNIPTRRLVVRAIFSKTKACCRRNSSPSISRCAPSKVITDYISRLIEFPEACRSSTRPRPGQPGGGTRLRGRLAGRKPIREMRDFLPPETDARIAAIFRGNQPVFPDGGTVVEAGDEVFLLAAAEHIRPVLRQLRR